MRKLIAFLLICTLAAVMGIPALATEVTPGNTVAENSDSATPWALSPPTSSHATPYIATITNLEAGHITYTKYYFSPVNETLTIAGSVYPVNTTSSAAHRVKILLYKVGTSANEDSYTTPYFYNGNGVQGILHTFNSLDPNAKYYFVIENLTANSLSEDRSISGSLVIN